jgi:hypothetical protein
VWLLVAWAPAAGADLVELEFTGEVLVVNPEFASIVSLGSALSGRLTYDTDATDIAPEPTVGRYPGATLEFTLGSYEYAGDGWIFVYDDPAFDQFQFLAETAGADPIGGLALAQLNLDFAAGPGLYTSDALPAAPPALDDPALIEPPGLRLGVLPAGSGLTYQGARLLTVPEADASGAGLAAGAALGALRRRRGIRRRG